MRESFHVDQADNSVGEFSLIIKKRLKHNRPFSFGYRSENQFPP